MHSSCYFSFRLQFVYFFHRNEFIFRRYMYCLAFELTWVLIKVLLESFAVKSEQRLLESKQPPNRFEPHPDGPNTSFSNSSNIFLSPDDDFLIHSISRFLIKLHFSCFCWLIVFNRCFLWLDFTKNHHRASDEANLFWLTALRIESSRYVIRKCVMRFVHQISIIICCYHLNSVVKSNDKKFIK